jgi:hypothetical protein
MSFRSASYFLVTLVVHGNMHMPIFMDYSTLLRPVAYSFVQAPFFFDDFTQASMKATPSTLSWTPGKMTSFRSLPFCGARQKIGLTCMMTYIV